MVNIEEQIKRSPYYIFNEPDNTNYFLFPNYKYCLYYFPPKFVEKDNRLVLLEIITKEKRWAVYFDSKHGNINYKHLNFMKIVSDDVYYPVIDAFIGFLQSKLVRVKDFLKSEHFDISSIIKNDIFDYDVLVDKLKEYLNHKF